MHPVNIGVNKAATMPPMASLRARRRNDGTEYFAVLYRLRGKQTPTSFDDFESASRFCELATKFGPGNALSTLKVDTTLSTMTVEQWLTKHNADLTGVDQGTVAKYRSYVKNDVGRPSFRYSSTGQSGAEGVLANGRPTFSRST